MSVRRIQSNTIQSAVYDTLKKGIMTLQLAPGTVMSTQEMANRLNVSRTPVRESFLRLQEEGLIEMIPQRETVVSRISLKRFDEERFLRESLEIAVIESFFKQCSHEDIVHLRSIIDEQWICCMNKDEIKLVELDDQMHRFIFEVAGQRLSWDTIMNVTTHYRRIRVLTVRTDEIMRSTVEQHEKILKLIEKKEINALRDELLLHVRKIHSEKKALLEQYPDYFEYDDLRGKTRVGTL